MTIKHASIVPLIGGQTLGQEKAMGSRPEWLASFKAFESNDSHAVNHYKDLPYYVMDDGGTHTPSKVDVISTTCPCAGLSSLSAGASSDAAANDWMYKTAELVLGTWKPKVFWGENAPGFAGKVGKPVVEKLHKIAREHNYSMSIYRTKSQLHGVPQIRERSFYFFWEGDRAPVFKFYKKAWTPIEDLIANVPQGLTQHIVTNKHTPSKDDPWYRYVLEHLEGGITHKEFFDKIEKTDNAMDWLERKGVSYLDVGKWMGENGYANIEARCKRIHDKLKDGDNIMRRLTTVPKNYIGAFVGHYPMMLTHPYEDRYITYREAMTIMGLPHDFELLNPKANLNHICQNVPVSTAADMAFEIKEYLEGNRDTVVAGDRILLQYNHSESQDFRDMIEVEKNSLEGFFS
jgi:site-specific DNA-cytosine methylase